MSVPRLSKHYEIIIIDDSTDETLEIIEEFQKSSEVADNNEHNAKDELKTKLKIIHRNNRKGFKGGALQEALRHINPKAEYVMVFDADFIPPPNIVYQFLAYFNNYNNQNHYKTCNRDNNNEDDYEKTVIETVNRWRKRREIAAVQKKEGRWIRTYKTGRITETVTILKLRHIVRGILPKRKREKNF